MNLSVSLEDIQHVENFLGQGDVDNALPALLEMRDEIEEYAEQACRATDHVQYFSFADSFELLAYRRVEKDPRSLKQVPVPFDRVYSDLAFAYLRQQEYALARDALKQAVRWDPMNCAYRLDLAELYRVLGNPDEGAALNYSVLARAADAAHFGRACAGLGLFFLDKQEKMLASGFARRAASYAPSARQTHQLLQRLMAEAPEEASASEEEAVKALEDQGFETDPNAEIAICLLMCATDAAQAGDRNEATNYTLRARDLVGEDAAKALIQLIHESDAELAAERAQGAAAEGERVDAVMAAAEAGPKAEDGSAAAPGAGDDVRDGDASSASTLEGDAHAES